MHAFSAESQAAAQSMGEAAASLKQSMGEAAASLKQSGDVLAANHKALVGGISKDIDRTYNAFFKSTNEVVERMGWVIEDVKNTIARLPDTVDEQRTCMPARRTGSATPFAGLRTPWTRRWTG